MLKAGALAAAALLALALGAPGCGLVDSLTPFGVGTQDYGAGAENLNGSWAGKNSTGGDVTFQVASSQVAQMLLYHLTSTAGCSYVSFDATTATANIVDDAFTLEMTTDNYGQGRIVIEGRFTSSSTCSGSYFFEALPAGACPSTGSGTFTAGKTP